MNKKLRYCTSDHNEIKYVQKLFKNINSFFLIEGYIEGRVRVGLE